MTFITGSSSGLGRAIALTYSSEGATIICTNLLEKARPESHQKSPIPTHELILRRGGNAIFIKVDVLIEHEVATAIQKTVDTYGRLDILVNNAGIAHEIHGIALKPGGNRIHESETKAFDLILAVNTRGNLSRGDITRGWIVNVASTAGLIALPGGHAYTASKHAVMGLTTEEIAVSYAQDRIHCNALCSSFIRTALIAEVTDNAENPSAVATRAGFKLVAGHPWGTLGVPEDVAGAAVFLVSEDAQWITGTGLVIDGGHTIQ